MEPVFVLSLPPLEHMPLVAAGLRAAGVRLIEVGAWGGHANLLDATGLAAAQRMLEQARVQAYSYHPPFGTEYMLTSPDPQKLCDAVEMNKRHMQAAAALGAKHYILHPSARIQQADRALAVKSFRHGLRELVAVADELDLFINVENMPDPSAFLGSQLDDLMWLVDAGDSDRVGVCLDTGHAYLCGYSMADAVAAVGQRLFTIHWHDNDRTGDQHSLPGNGTINWREFFEALSDIGWDKPVCLETRWPTSSSAEEFVSAVREALAERRAIVPGRQ
ncbi:MAG: sugar phosphate isomerase/epimerase [Armatimonadetes bacterium]|nr:sugar phosphate isomerase/epimerase [Armatimonadota bacterium]